MGCTLMQYGDDASRQVIEQSREGAQIWTGLQTVVGQSTSFPKSAVQLLCHKESQRSPGTLEMDYGCRN